MPYQPTCLSKRLIDKKLSNSAFKKNKKHL